MKSPKAVKYSLIGSVIIFLSVCLLIVLISLLINVPISAMFIFSCSLAFGISSYFLFSILLNTYLIERLKPIYKNLVRHTPGNYKISTYNNMSAADIADEIYKKLSALEENQKEEIGQLMKLELFRKEFLGNVSHELKTPIFSVQGYIHTLIDGGIEDSNINMLYLKKAAKSLDRLIIIVDDLESISKLEDGELKLEKQTFDINSWVKDTIESLELMAIEKGVKLKVDPKTDKAFYVSADKNAIRQVLVNLIVNSIKYSSVEGTTEISYFEDVNKVLVNIKDNGIGISEEDQDRLFERFYRADKSRNREQGGTGLGLAIVKHIVETHGGEIGINSEIGKGSTFTFSLDKA